MPKGVELFNKLQEMWRVEHKKRGYQEIKTPIMLDEGIIGKFQDTGLIIEKICIHQ